MTNQARALALTCPDPMAEITAATYAREVNRDIDIVAVSHGDSMSNRLNGIGVSEVVVPAFESSLEFVRHILRYYNVGSLEVEAIVCPFLREREASAAHQDGDVREKLV